MYRDPIGPDVLYMAILFLAIAAAAVASYALT